MEESVIKSAQRGNRDDFRKIVELYGSLVFAISYNVLKDYHEAENAAQETFIEVYRSLPSYEFKGFKAWISKIALNKSIDIRRKNEKIRNLSPVSFQEGIEEQVSGGMTPEDEVIANEETRRIHGLCNKLPEVYGKVIHKYYMEAKSYEEIASEEGISIRAVESRLYRGKKKLKEELGEGG